MDADMKCPICGKPFSLTRLPIRSQCKHTLCSQCAQQAHSNSSLRCPVCRCSSPMSLSDLPINRSLYCRMMKTINDRCQDHRKTHYWYCVDCCRALCKKCISQHTKHDFVELEDKRLERLIDEKMRTMAERLKGPIEGIQEYRDRVEKAIGSLDSRKGKIQCHIQSWTNSLISRLQTTSHGSVAGITALHQSAKAALSQLQRKVDTELSRCAASYRDFEETASSVQTLDRCSQLRFIEKLESWPQGQSPAWDDPVDKAQEFDAILETFRASVTKLIEGELNCIKEHSSGQLSPASCDLPERREDLSD